MRRRLFGSAAAFVLALLPLGLIPLVTFADVPATVASYDASGHAAAVHVVGYSGSFPNFSTGAVDNRYPLASFSMDSSPGSSATSTYEDYGPLGATEYPGGVAYAEAHYPNQEDASVDLNNANPGPAPGAPSGVPPALIPTPLPTPVTSNGPRATAHAQELSANAYGVYVGSTSTALQGAWSRVSSEVASSGVLTETAESYVQTATLASGALVFKNVDVVAQIVNSGGDSTTTQKVSVGSVTVGGQTVELSDSAVTFNLGGLLYSISLAAPQKTVDGAQTSLNVTGVHVGVSAPATQPPQGPGVPATSADLILGEAQLYSVLNPSTQESVSLGFQGPIGELAGAGIGVTSAPPPVAPLPITEAPKASGPIPHFALAAASRKPLAIAFLAWETLVLSGVAAWVWARKAVAA